MSLSKNEIDYPRDSFGQIISGNSPYAFYLFQWVDYRKDAMRYRLKLMHDVKLFDGTVVENCYPNGNSFHGKIRVNDDDVEFIRISKEQFGNEYKDPRGG